VTTPQPNRPARRRSVTLAVAVVLADQVAKLAAEQFAGGHRHGPVVPLRNPSFSLGLATTTRPLTVLAMAAGIALAAAYATSAAGRGGLPGWVPALVVGGAASNLLDRLLLGAVRDFLAVGHLVVNPADLAVLAGLVGYGLTRLARPPAASPPPGKGVHP
jgi:lipoprotein signal peptidase